MDYWQSEYNRLREENEALKGDVQQLRQSLRKMHRRAQGAETRANENLDIARKAKRDEYALNHEKAKVHGLLQVIAHLQKQQGPKSGQG